MQLSELEVKKEEVEEDMNEEEEDEANVQILLQNSQELLEQIALVVEEMKVMERTIARLGGGVCDNAGTGGMIGGYDCGDGGVCDVYGNNDGNGEILQEDNAEEGAKM